ncbi:MAG: antibiotic biosynthesis monooxygenase family protein [Pseudomonas sp.]|uniref:putative quinol monooxygenase n=1 Tax=Pseudomonas sp. TaxID=306 RepID=UPI00271B5D3E|nr:antibiotic biosynthesis monooxygenase family protein [Pseudomonas sp.]MDO9617157.1 antibiotic biosynthesis monooxygenase family protein [Pseudomonas sp.]MDP2445446.1 antibiotic biosynthesis monooxygenase family protein [Pseudomonas sp.]MDZ4335768.1 antibiotic biosynthesis monooxygenase family protein [Pseudomonas sp.]
MLSHSAVLHARAGRAEQLGGCLHGLAESMQIIPGCLGVELQQLPDDAAQWLLQSRWQSTAALQAFFAAPLLQQTLDQVLQQGLLRSLQCQAA